MKPIRLAVIFDQQIRAGGGYQQALNAALLTREVPKELAEVIFFTTVQENISTLATHGINAKTIFLSFFEKSRAFLRKRISDTSLLKFIQKIELHSPLEKQLIEHEIDLVYFLSPSSWSQCLEKLNYITTVWDLCHRDDPEFPEVRWNRQLESRDRNYRAVLPRATAIFVDSELGKENAARRYGVDLERIHVIPFQAAEVTRREVDSKVKIDVNIREKYQLDIPYVFYPAQFWAHKNHVYLLEGLHALQETHGMRIGAIFSGGDQGNLSYIEAYVRKLGLQDLIRFAGFVTNEEIVSLYRQSIALVMPSYFGPTNLPPLEAFQLGVPVLYSDKVGLRDQVGDAALVMNLKDPNSMALHLKNLIEDEQLRRRLIAAGFERVRHFDAFDRVGVLQKVISDFRWRRLCWE
jgi:glycosyltransferase involved in cell wall biosynthesis